MKLLDKGQGLSRLVNDAASSNRDLDEIGLSEQQLLMVAGGTNMNLSTITVPPSYFCSIVIPVTTITIDPDDGESC